MSSHVSPPSTWWSLLILNRKKQGQPYLCTFNDILALAEPTEELRAAILIYYPIRDDVKPLEDSAVFNYFGILKDLVCLLRPSIANINTYLNYNFGDGMGGSVYKRHLDIWKRYVKQRKPAKIGEEDKISSILRVIQAEEVWFQF